MLASRRFGVSAFLTGFLAAGSACAEETQFGGVFIGTDIAYSLANNEVALGASGDTLTFDGWGARGFSGGGFVGYDHLYGNGFLLGGQIGGQIADITSAISYSDTGSDSHVRGELQTDWLATLTARGGLPDQSRDASVRLARRHRRARRGQLFLRRRLRVGLRFRR